MVYPREAPHLAHHSFALQPQASAQCCCQEEPGPAGLAQREVGSVKKEISLLTRNRARVNIHSLSQLDSKLSPHTRLPGRISTQVTIAQGTEASQLGMSSGLQQYPQP